MAGKQTLAFFLLLCVAFHCSEAFLKFPKLPKLQKLLNPDDPSLEVEVAEEEELFGLLKADKLFKKAFKPLSLKKLFKKLDSEELDLKDLKLDKLLDKIIEKKEELAEKKGELPTYADKKPSKIVDLLKVKKPVIKPVPVLEPEPCYEPPAPVYPVPKIVKVLEYSEEDKSECYKGCEEPPQGIPYPKYGQAYAPPAPAPVVPPYADLYDLKSFT